MKRSLTSLRSEIARREAITPFICSTFKDFAGEREYLASKIFPKLNRICRERGSCFLPVDLRWNEDSCNSNTFLVLQQCLDAIEQCSPYFICLLGERYGVHRPAESMSLPDEGMGSAVEWLGKNFEMAAACGNEWLLEDENRHCSITELEIIKASFRERTDHGYFYFREPEHLHKQGVDNQDVSKKAMLMEVYESENEFAAMKVRELKQQIIDTELPVKYFRSVEELGNLVFKDWLSVLNSLYPPTEKKIFSSTVGADFREWSNHETFAETRRKVFVTTSTLRIIFDVLTRHAHFSSRFQSRASSAHGPLTKINEGAFLTNVPGLETFPSIVALVGERGSGLTAILANWSNKLIRENPETVVMSHYTESDQRSTEITSFMRRCTRELRSQYRRLHSITEIDFLGLTDFESITEAFNASLSLGPCVIVLDGLSHLSSCQDIPAHVIKQLAWLPDNLPEHCRVVVSTTRSDISSKHLSGRSDVHIIDVPPLQGNDEKLRVLHDWLGKHARYLDERDQTTIVAGKLSRSPLYHVVLANEIRLYGSARISEKQLETYTRARDFSDFWTAVIHRWSHDYSWLKPTLVKNGLPMKTQVSKDRLNNGWLPDALRLISVSREGLSSDELKRILHAFGYSRKHAISPAAWQLFTSAARHAIYVTENGLLSFQHASMREAVDFLLLNGLTSPSRARHVTGFDNPWEVQKFQYHSVIMRSFQVFEFDERLVSELPWQQMATGDVEGLRKTLSRPDVFVTTWSNRRDLRGIIDFLNYWKFLTENGCDAIDTYFAMVTEAERALTSGDSEDSVDNEDVVCMEGNLRISDRIIGKLSGEEYSSIEVSYLAYLVGVYFLGRKDLVSAELMLLKAFKLACNVTSIDDVDFLCEVQKSIGDLYYEGKSMDKAFMFYEQALKTASEVTRYVNIEEVDFLATQAHVHNRLAAITVRSTLTSLRPRTAFPSSQLNAREINVEDKKDHALGLVPRLRDQLDEAARAMEIAKMEEGKASLHHTMALRALCETRDQDAEILFNQAVDEAERWYGPSHPAVADILQDQARYHSRSDCEANDVSRIEKIYRRALNIRETKLGRSHLDVADTLMDLGCLLQGKGTRDGKEESRRLLQRATDIRSKKLGANHESTKDIRKILVKL